jgi:nitrite reductase (NO-forming)
MNLPRPLVLFLAFCGGAAIFATPLVLGAIALGTGRTTASPAASTPAAASTAASPSSGALLGTITINAIDLGFEPASVEVPQAGRYTVMFMNKGKLAHDITFADGTKIPAAGGAMATGEVVSPAGGLTFICSVPGHEAAGMKGAVTVAGAQASGSPAPGGSTAPAA